jgi:hypothetical protein
MSRCFDLFTTIVHNFFKVGGNKLFHRRLNFKFSHFVEQGFVADL